MTDVEVRGARTPPAVLAQLTSLADRLRGWTLKLALVATAAAAVIAFAIVRDGYPSGARAVLATLALVLVAVPPLLLAAFWFALGELIQLPSRLRRLPLEGREHVENLRTVLSEARADRTRRLALPRTLWRLRRVTVAARETLTPYAPLLPFLSAPFLFAVALAVFAAFVEIATACVVAIVLAVS